MGSFIVVSVKMKLVISTFLPYLVFSQNVKLSGKLDAEALNNAFGGDSYYVQGDMIVNHGVINEAEGKNHGREEIRPKFGTWFSKCFMSEEQRKMLYMMKNEMEKSGGKHQMEKGSGDSKNYTQASNYRTRRSSHEEDHDETNLMSNFSGMSDEMKDKLDEMDMDLDMMHFHSFI